MGKTKDVADDAWKESERRFKKLKEDGKTSEEINTMFEEESLQELGGKLLNLFNIFKLHNNNILESHSALEILKELYAREDKESQLLQEELKAIDDSEHAKLILFLSLKYQCKRIEMDNTSFVSAATSTALAERRQNSNFEM